MKFRKKPIVIEAFQLQQDFFTPFIKNKEEKFKPKLEKDGSVSCLETYIEHVFADLYIAVKKDTETLFVKTIEGDMRASLGDWIIKGVNGEFYFCKPDIFEKTYEQVEE